MDRWADWPIFRIEIDFDTNATKFCENSSEYTLVSTLERIER